MDVIAELRHRLYRLKKVFDIDSILALSIGQEYVNTYYHVNRKAYDIFQLGTDLLHCAISDDGKFKKKDFLWPTKFIDQYIAYVRPHAVLELAMGRGANSAYLAQQHPDIRFYGIDISDTQLVYAKKKVARIKNFIPLKGNMDELPSIGSERFGVIFIIEALCHSGDIQAVFRKVYKLLAPGGMFIVVDGYRGMDLTSVSPEESQAFRLMEKGVAVNEFVQYSDFCSRAQRAGFEIIQEEDVSKKILPFIQWHSRRSNFLFHFPAVVKVMRKVFSDLFLLNFVTALFAPYFIEHGYYKHMVTVFHVKGD